MNYEDYKVEELEDAAVKKSNIAKTVGIAAGMGVIGAGAAVAANSLMDDEEKETAIVEDTDISAEDLVDGASQGANNTTIVEEKHITEPNKPTTPHYEGNDKSGGDETRLTVDQNVTVVDEEGNVLASQTTGTLDGKAYVATDYDGDGLVDEIYYDVNGDGEFTPDEGGMLDSSDQFAMSSFGQATNSTVYVQPTEGGGDGEIGEGEDVVDPGDKDIDDIDNDLDENIDDNTGNEDETALYEDDYADNNLDYNNDADISDFA